MKLTGLMLYHHDDWIAGLTARAALKWCDEIIVLNYSSTGETTEPLLGVASENPGRAIIMSGTEESDEAKGIYRNIMLEEARRREATHIALLDPEEVVTDNLLSGIRKMIEGLKPGHSFNLPSIFCWKSLGQYRADPEWRAKRSSTPIVVMDAPSMRWNAGESRLPQGINWTRWEPIKPNTGGVLHLECANWKQARAKYYLRKMRESLHRATWKSEPKKRPDHDVTLDERGIKLAKIPFEWWGSHLEFAKSINIDATSWYEGEVKRLSTEHGGEAFSGIDIPGEVIGPQPWVIPKPDIDPPRAPLDEVKMSIIKVRTVKTEQKLKIAPKRTLSWSGHFYDYSGYGKANREMLFRVGNTFQVLLSSELNNEVIAIEDHVKRRIDAHRSSSFQASHAYLRFFGPREETYKGYKICYTMMETYGAHRNLVELLNQYDEVWTPTQWNMNIFKAAGVKPPGFVMPLGVNEHVFRPEPPAITPPMRLLTTEQAGNIETPKGFLFVNVSNPSSRKGLDVIVRAFEDAFNGDPDAALVLCVSYSSLIHCSPFELVPGGRAACRSKIYCMEGGMTEDEMANLYRSCQAYTTASKGEGWNLPLMEAAACGLPVIAPKAFSHLDFLNDNNAFLFNPDDLRAIPGSEKISEWYRDQLFTHYGDKAIETITSLMRKVKEDKVLAAQKAANLRKLILEKYTWDIAATHLVRRLMDVCG